MGEALREALREIAARPGRFAAEVVQFLLLAGVIALVGRRAVRDRLSKRRVRIASELADAERAEREAGALRAEAGAVMLRAEEEGPALVAAAREQAGRDRAAAIAEAEAEARSAIHSARESVERERTRVVQEVSERLVRLTTETARRYLDEMLTDGERRALTEKAVLDSLAELERGAAPRRVE